MPALPEILSQMAYSTTPQPMQAPDALGRADQALQAGMAQVAGQFAEISGRLAAAQQVSDASAFTTKAAMELQDIRLKYQQDPDPATVKERFQKEIEDWKKSGLDSIQDNGVRHHVARDLSHRLPVLYAEVTGDSTRRHTQQLVGGLQDTLSKQAQLLAGAGNAADHALAMQSIKSALAGARAAGLIDVHQGNGLFSQAVKQAITIQSATDPAKAKKLLDAYAVEMNAGDVATLTTGLQHPLQRQTINQAVQAQVTASAGDPAKYDYIKNRYIALGYDEATSSGLAANSVAESGGRHNGPTGDGGKAVGLFQWHPDRQARFEKRHGRPLAQATLDEQIDFSHSELQNEEANALAEIKAAGNTPGEKAAAISRAYLRPGLRPADREAEQTKRAALAERLASGGQPTEKELMDGIRQRTANDPFEVQEGALRAMRERYHLDQAGLTGPRADLHRKVGDLMTGYDNGLTKPEIPKALILSLLPPEDAKRTIEQLEIGRSAGDLFRGVQWASPEEEQAAREQLAVPGSLAAMQARKNGSTVGVPAGSAEPAEETPDGLKTRLHVAAKYEELLNRKRQALIADPHAFAMAHPDIQARFKSVDQYDGSTLRSANDASLALQARLAVPENARRVLSNAQVATLAAQLGADPAKADMGLALDNIAKQFGEHYPRAFGELVKVGKISADYQLLAAADHPSQVFARQDFQRVLRYAAQKNGMEGLRQDVPKAAMKQIDDGIDATMEEFRATTKWSQGGLELFSTMQQGVKKLAMYYAIQGESGEKALEKAYGGLFGLKYDTHDTMIAPKDQMNAVRSAAFQIQDELKPDQIATPPARSGMPGETEADRRAAMFAAAQRGKWVPSADGAGLTLMAQLHNGQVMPVHRADGEPVRFRFDKMPAPSGRWRAPSGRSSALSGGSPVPPALPFSAPSANRRKFEAPQDEVAPVAPAGTPPNEAEAPPIRPSMIQNRPVGATVQDWWNGEVSPEQPMRYPRKEQ